MSPGYWAQIFGGGGKKKMGQIETAPGPPGAPGAAGASDLSASESSDLADQSLLNTMTSITKQRVKLNIKVLGVQLGASQESPGGGGTGSGAGGAPDRPSYRQAITVDSAYSGHLGTGLKWPQ